LHSLCRSPGLDQHLCTGVLFETLLLAQVHNKVFVGVQSLEEEEKMTPEQLAIKNVGKQVQSLLSSF